MEADEVNAAEEVYKKFLMSSDTDVTHLIPILYAHNILSKEEIRVLESIKCKTKRGEALFVQILPSKNEYQQSVIAYFLEVLAGISNYQYQLNPDVKIVASLKHDLTLSHLKIVENLKIHAIQEFYDMNRKWEVLFEKFGMEKPSFSTEDFEIYDVSFNDNFNLSSKFGGKQKRFIVKGDAAVGKGSYLTSFTDKWAINKSDLDKYFTFVILLNLNQLKPDSTLVEALETALPTKLALELYEILQNDECQTRALFILLNFDKNLFTLDSAIMSIICGRKLPSATVITSTRSLYLPLLFGSKAEVFTLMGLKQSIVYEVLQKFNVPINSNHGNAFLLRNPLYLSMCMLLQVDQLVPLAKLMRAFVRQLMAFDNSTSAEIKDYQKTDMLLYLGESSLLKLGYFEKQLLSQDALRYIAFIEEAGGVTIDKKWRKIALSIGLVRKKWHVNRSPRNIKNFYPLHHAFFEHFASLYIAHRGWMMNSRIPLILPQPFAYFCSDQSFDFGSKLLMAGMFCCKSDNPSITAGASLVCKFSWLGNYCVPSKFSFDEIETITNVMIIGSKKESDVVLSQVLLSSITNVKHLHFHQSLLVLNETNHFFDHMSSITVLRFSDLHINCGMSLINILLNIQPLKELFIYNCQIDEIDDHQEKLASISNKFAFQQLRSFSFFEKIALSPKTIFQVNRWPGEQWPMELIETKVMDHVNVTYPLQSVELALGISKNEGNSVDHVGLMKFLSLPGVTEIGIYLFTDHDDDEKVVGPIKMNQILLRQRKFLTNLFGCLFTGTLTVKQQNFLSLFCWNIIKALEQEFNISYHSLKNFQQENLLKKMVKTKCVNLLSLMKTIHNECKYEISMDTLQLEPIIDTISSKVLNLIRSQAYLEENIIVQSLMDVQRDSQKNESSFCFSKLFLLLSKTNALHNLDTLQVAIETDQDYEMFVSFLNHEDGLKNLKHLSVWFSNYLSVDLCFFVELCLLPRLSSLAIHGYPDTIAMGMNDRDDMEQVFNQLKENLNRQSKNIWSTGHCATFKSSIFMSLI